jgi:hypothetical protein
MPARCGTGEPVIGAAGRVTVWSEDRVMVVWALRAKGSEVPEPFLRVGCAFASRESAVPTRRECRVVKER